MPTLVDLANLIEQRITSRTHGRVRRVSVDVSDEHIVLSGEATTYYARQLAQHAAMEVLADRVLVNSIQVGLCG